MRLRLGVVAAGLAAAAGQALPAWAANPIQHVIIIVQENRSFDNYFGTFPGANGIPSGVCLQISLTDPTQGCVQPWHDVHDYSLGSNHDAKSAQNDLDDGITQAKMDGFVATQVNTFQNLCASNPKDIHCTGSANSFTEHDAMGYHTATEIPNYWAYAQHFVLHDSMFAEMRSWSQPSHVGLTSEWLATCDSPTMASTCRTVNSVPPLGKDSGIWPWVSLFQLLDMHNVSWKYYYSDGSDPDCDDAELTCPPQNQARSPSPVWNPPRLFTYVASQGPAYLASHNPLTTQFWTDIKKGTLPQVSWIIPDGFVSEHPYGNSITIGMEWVTSIVNEVMQSSYWNNTVIFVVWDDWGGFYDNAVPPIADFSDPVTNIRPDYGFVQGFGLRVPALTISPWVHAGLVDHQLLSFDSFATFIEDLFMGGARLDPVAMGVPDARPSVRDALTTVSYPNGSQATIGKLMNDFDFTQTPLPPLILSTHIPGDIITYCRKNPNDRTYTCQSPTVTITWSPVTGPDVAGPFTYHVQRDGVELTQCIGTAATCTDTPGSGDHFYRVYSVDSTNTASPLSAASEAIEP